MPDMPSSQEGTPDSEDDKAEPLTPEGSSEEDVVDMIKVFYRITKDQVDQAGRPMSFDGKAIESYKTWARAIMEGVVERIAKKRSQRKILEFVSSQITPEFGGINNQTRVLREVFGPLILRQKGWSELPKE